MTECEKSEEHMHMRVAGFDRLPQTVVIETEVWLVHRVVGEVNSRCTLMKPTTTTTTRPINLSQTIDILGALASEG